MTRRPLSPIERMIDTATGFDEFKAACHAPDPSPIIECPVCGITKHTWRHKYDPKGTAKIISCCPKCDDGRNVIFADKDGNILKL